MNRWRTNPGERGPRSLPAGRETRDGRRHGAPSTARRHGGNCWGLGPVVILIATLLWIVPAPAAAQKLAEIAPVGAGVFLIGGLGAAPLEVGGVVNTSLLSTTVSLVRGGNITRLAAGTGPHLTAGPLRLFGRLGGGYEWSGSEGRFVIRMTYGGEVALSDTAVLILQGGTSLAAASSGWTQSEDAALSLGIGLFFGPSSTELRSEQLRQTYRNWPPELAEEVARGSIPEALAAARYPDWSVDELRLVSQGRVAAGMTPEMVETVLGRPDEVDEVQDPALGPLQIWRYYETVGVYDPYTGRPVYRRELRRTVIFRAGTVYRLESGPGRVP